MNDEMVPYDSEDGVYACETYTTAKLLSEVGLEACDEVLEDIDSCLPDLTWCKKQLDSTNLKDALEMGWMAFVEIVKHQTRYFFSEPQREAPDPEAWPRPNALGVGYDSSEGVAPERILDALAEIVRRTELVTTLEAGTTIFRARVHRADEYPLTPAELGPPPPGRASQSNRMSPAGIVMFYGAFDAETAIRETFKVGREGAAEEVISLAQFTLNRSLTVLNIAKLPPVPSFFGDYELRHGISFLQGFERDFTKFVDRDGMEHVEYVPTQVVTEYFRFRFRCDDDENIEGVVYRSSTATARPACVLFFNSSHCGADDVCDLRLRSGATERFLGSELGQYLK